MDVGHLSPIPTGSFWQFSCMADVFSSFWVLDFWGCFEALNNIFRDIHNKIVDKVIFLGKHVYSSNRPFQWAIMRLKCRSYAKVTTPGS
jgi:hypothetical protein